MSEPVDLAVLRADHADEPVAEIAGSCIAAVLDALGLATETLAWAASRSAHDLDAA